MVKRLSLVALLMAAFVSFGGCRFAAPVFESAGGADCVGRDCDDGPDKTSMVLREWGRDARKNERFVDQYFLNYDINDPYRGDCLIGH